MMIHVLYLWAITWVQGWVRRRAAAVAWDDWRGSMDGRPTMWLKRLLWIPVGYSVKRRKWLGCRLDLHKFVRADDLGAFHTHPAYAVRIILHGGYVEEVYTGEPAGEFVDWLPGMWGLVRPQLAHRVHRVLHGESWSLWFRGPICAPIHLVGDGWPADAVPEPGAGQT